MTDERTCGKCGLPIHPNETGLRSFGFYTAHAEHRCYELMRLEIDALRHDIERHIGIAARQAEEVDALRRERDEARENGREWHRRAQRAEAACAAAREDKPRSSGGRSLGRALANAAAEHYRDERDAAMALLKKHGINYEP